MTPCASSEAASGEPASGQRIDRWLWCARFFKTRALAAKFVGEGHIRLSRATAPDDRNTIRVEKPSALVRAGDTLVFTRHDRLRIIEVSAYAARRGPAAEAATLYEDHSPQETGLAQPKAEKTPAPFARDAGAGRPTKRERRALDALRTGRPADRRAAMLQKGQD